MLKHTRDLAEDEIDAHAALPADRDALLVLVLRCMALEREACARDIEEMPPDVAATSSQHSSRADVHYVLKTKAASVIRSRKVRA